MSIQPPDERIAALEWEHARRDDLDDCRALWFVVGLGALVFFGTVLALVIGYVTGRWDGSL